MGRRGHGSRRERSWFVKKEIRAKKKEKRNKKLKRIKGDKEYKKWKEKNNG